MVFQSSEFEDGAPTHEVSSRREVETMTKAPPGSAGDLWAQTPATDAGGDNTTERPQDSLTETKTVRQADKDYQLAGPHTPRASAKANSLPAAASRERIAVAVTVTEAFEDAAPQTRAGDSGTDVAHAETESLRASADGGVGSASAMPCEMCPTETHHCSTEGAGENFRPAEGRPEVMGFESAKVGRGVKSAATQTDETAESAENTPHRHQKGAVLDAGTQTDGGQEEEEEEEDELTDSPCPSPEQAAECEKLLRSSSFPIPANPAHLAERIRRNRSRMSAAYDDTEYEPYGLPEVVMKGQSVSPPSTSLTAQMTENICVYK